jgi:hypothetical protein
VGATDDLRLRPRWFGVVLERLWAADDGQHKWVKETAPMRIRIAKPACLKARTANSN